MKLCLNNIIEDNRKLWCLFFICTALVAFFIQLVALPYIFRNWHAGDGLLKSSLDSIGFQKAALKLYENIKINGWGVWELRPQGYAPAGIAAIVYVLSFPKLWTMIPLNAALHATAAVLLLLIIQNFIPQRKRALLAIIPFLVFPSAASWYAQLHKEGFFIVGNFILIYGWIFLAKFRDENNFRLFILKAILYICLGIFFIWIVRPETIRLIQYVNLFVFLLIIVNFFKRIKQKNISKVHVYISIVMIIIVPFSALNIIDSLSDSQVFLSLPLSKYSDATLEQLTLRQRTFSEQPNEEQWHSGRSSSPARANETPSFYEKYPSNKTLHAIEPTRTGSQEKNARSSVKKRNQIAKMRSVLKSKIDNRVETIISRRKGFITTFGLSNIDDEINFKGWMDLVHYVPRAFQIAFFSPFPKQWLETGSYEANTLMRRIAGVETLIVYLALCFFVFSFLRWHNRIEFWIIVVLSGSMMLFYAFIVCNVGTLYRMRYGYLMTFVALGISGAIQALSLSTRKLNKYVRNSRIH